MATINYQTTFEDNAGNAHEVYLPQADADDLAGIMDADWQGAGRARPRVGGYHILRLVYDACRDHGREDLYQRIVERIGQVSTAPRVEGGLAVYAGD